MNSLVGRAHALDALVRLRAQRDVRLVTLTGPGGIGKTRLAIEAMQRLRRANADRIAFVDLAAVHDARLVLATIANALGVADDDGRLVQAIAAWTGERRSLLVLDNFEHVLDAAADVTRLLSASRALQVLITTRAALHVQGEHALAVEPLQVPSGDISDLQTLAAAESVTLFLERARAARADFTLTPDNARAVADICIGLAGIPLASVQRSRGNPRRAIELCNESLAIFRAAHDQRWCANALNSLGMSVMDIGAFSAAREPLEEALSLYRRLGGTRGIAIALGNLGDLDRFESDYDHAEARLRQSLELFHQLDDAWGSSAALESLALVASARGCAERAALLFGAAEAQRLEAGAALAPADVPVHEQAVHSLQMQLGVDGLRTAFDRGRALSRSCALAFAQQLGAVEPLVGARATGSALVLTEREREVAALVARGLTNRQIADALVFTRHTADKHVTNILGKLELSSRAQLAVWWVAHAGQPVRSS